MKKKDKYRCPYCKKWDKPIHKCLKIGTHIDLSTIKEIK